jgi:hypothetical protein
VRLDALLAVAVLAGARIAAAASGGGATTGAGPVDLLVILIVHVTAPFSLLKVERISI